MKTILFPATATARLVLGFLLPHSLNAIQAAPVITEFLASNPGPDTDDTGLRSDWVELHNPDNSPADLTGWSLTDDPENRKKWMFPAVTLSPGGYLRVWASGLDHRDPGGALHTNFKLRGSGGSLLLFPPAGPAASAFNPYPRQFSGFSYGRPAGKPVPAWFPEPTPEAQNSAAGLTDYVRDTHFSRPRGFLETAASVNVTADTPGAEIRYTIDGSEPTPASPLFTAPLPLTNTTILRVRGFKAGFVPGNTDTRSWIFPAAWLKQPDAPAGFPATWGNPLKNGQLDPTPKVLADYGMDPVIAADSGMKAALTGTLPVLCVTGNLEDIFGTDGIMGNGRTGDSEKPVAVEYFNPADPADTFSARATFQAHGGGVREFAKKAFRLDFSGGGSEGALHYPLFAGSSSETFDQLVLRPGGHDSFTVRAAGLTSLDPYDLAGHASYLRDQFLRRTENEMGLLSPRGRYVHLCLNGLYWGLYDLHERPNARYAAGYQGGAEDDWDVLHHPQSGTAAQVVDGNDSDWNEMQAIATGAFTPEDFARLKNLTGPDTLIDHLLARIWAGDFDWLGPAYMPGVDGINPTSNIAFYQNKNWYALRRSRGVSPGSWQFFTWDAEISMGSHLLQRWTGVPQEQFPDNFAWPVPQRRGDFDFTGISRANTPAAPWAALLQDPEYRLHTADRIRKLYFNDGALSPAAAQSRLASLITELDAPILAESARWGDVSGFSYSMVSGQLVQIWKNQRITREKYWRPEVAWLHDTFAAQRAGIVTAQFRARGIYPLTEPADIAPSGGPFTASDKISLTQPDVSAKIYYTLDGTDPRVPLTGAVSAPALPAAGPINPPDAESFVLKTRVLKSGEWSALTEARFTSAVPPTAVALAITEIHYHPADPSVAEISAGFNDSTRFEFLEITNRSVQPVALQDLRFAAGIDFDFATGTAVREIAAGGSLLLASDHDAFLLRYGFEPAGVFANGTRLANGGEQIKLVTARGAVIADFTYSDANGWPEAADGTGKSLTLLAPFSGSDGSTPSQWRAAGPTPGNVATSLSYAEWQTDFFTPGEVANPQISGPLADPDGDGLPNLAEYLTVSNPTQSTAGPGPISVTQPQPGQIRFEWPLRADAVNAAALLELTADLKNWKPTLQTPVSTTRGVTLQRMDHPSNILGQWSRLRVSMTP